MRLSMAVVEADEYPPHSGLAPDKYPAQRRMDILRSRKKAIVSVATEELGAHALLVDKIEGGRIFIRDPLPEVFGTSYSVSVIDFARIFNKKYVILR